MKHFVVIYGTTCLKNTAHNVVGDYVIRSSCVFSEDVFSAEEKFMVRFRNSIKHNEVDVIHVIECQYLLDILNTVAEICS